MIPVEEIWSFWLQHKQELEDKYICIASNEAEEIDIYLTNDYGFPTFQIEVAGIDEVTEFSIEKEDTEETYQRILHVMIGDTTEELSTDDRNRVDEITAAVTDMLEILMENPACKCGFDETEIDSLVLDIETLLCEKYGALVRHPELRMDEKTGKKIVVQYPYE